MRLTVLGNNGPYPAPGGACSGYLVTEGGARVQLDLGGGTLAALTALTPPEGLTALVFSHWHHDHCSDALPLIYRLADHMAKGGAPLEVYGPADETSPVRAQLALCPGVRLHTLAPGDEVSLAGLTLTAFAARHPVPALMYRIRGASGTLCYTGDTNTVEGLADFAREADLLLADGLFTREAWTEDKPHLSAELAARLASDACVRRLVITHLNPTVDPALLLAQARAVRIDAELAVIGKTYTL
ncbi:MAG: MBL fold metallo-hydrolase [Clostridia bacterium]|nr:MBL fold metallo-hydrolase [Clostridia bacterium]